MSTAELKPGARVDGRYRLERRLGVGGFGSVWLAEDEASKPIARKVALKMLHPRLLEASPIIAERFQLEAEVLAKLDHPNIVRPLAFRLTGDQAYLAMELVEGLPLDRVLKECARRGEHVERAELVRVFDELAAAVHYAHGEGVVHRDLKPSNVMIVRRSGRVYVKVLDLGIAKVLAPSGRDATTVGRVVGTLYYASPEQVRGEGADARSDVFALGVILFELVTLCRAFVADADGRPASAAAPPLRSAENTPTRVFERITRGPRPKPSDVREGIPLELDDVVARALAIDPSARHQSAAALAEDALPHLRHLEVTRGTTIFALGSELAPADDELLHARAASVLEVDTPAIEAKDDADTPIIGRDRPLGAGAPARAKAATEAGPPTQIAAREERLARTPRRMLPTAIPVALASVALGALVAALWVSSRRPTNDVEKTAANVAREAATATVGASPRALATHVDARGAGLTPGEALPRSEVDPSAARADAGDVRLERSRSAPFAAPDRATSDRTTSGRAPRERADRAANDARPAMKELERLLARAREEPADPSRTAVLADAIRAAARRLPSGPLRARIERKAEAGAIDGDLDALSACVKMLEDAPE